MLPLVCAMALLGQRVIYSEVEPVPFARPGPELYTYAAPSFQASGSCYSSSFATSSAYASSETFSFAPRRYALPEFAPAGSYTLPSSSQFAVAPRRFSSRLRFRTSTSFRTRGAPVCIGGTCYFP